MSDKTDVGSTIDYENFAPDGDGYSITFVNRSADHKAEFYIIVLGFDFRGATVFRQRLYIDFLPGYGEITYLRESVRMGKDVTFSDIDRLATSRGGF